MKCYACKNPATAICQRCGRSVCNSHQATNRRFEDGAKIICPQCDYDINSMPEVIQPEVIQATVVQTEKRNRCSKCGGSGQIGGLLRRRPCPRCGGSGNEPE